MQSWSWYCSKALALSVFILVTLTGCDNPSYISSYIDSPHRDSFASIHLSVLPRTVSAQKSALDQSDKASDFIKKTQEGRQFLATFTYSIELYSPLSEKVETITSLLSDPQNYLDPSRVSDKLSADFNVNQLLTSVRENNIKADVLYEMQKLSNSFVIVGTSWDSYLKGNLERDYNALLVATADTFTTEQSIYVTKLYTNLHEDINDVIEFVSLVNDVLMQK